MASSAMLHSVALVRTDVRRLLVTASVVRSSQILVTLMKEAISSSETWMLATATRRNIQEDAILGSHRRENLSFYGNKAASNSPINLMYWSPWTCFVG
jgi:hypothetical protein